jgi:hypothetical protein
MKFNDLYNRVFISEQNETEVADPTSPDFNDVEPAPLPELTPEVSPEMGETEPTASPESASSITDYINQIEDFANKLNGTDGSSLQSLVSKLDRVETPFEGIYSRTSAEIVDAAKTLRSVSEKLKNFIIHAAKK